MVIFTLRIHEYVIDGIVQKQLRKIFQFQFYKNYKVCYSVVMQGEVGGDFDQMRLMFGLLGGGSWP